MARMKTRRADKIAADNKAKVHNGNRFHKLRKRQSRARRTSTMPSPTPRLWLLDAGDPLHRAGCVPRAGSISSAHSSNAFRALMDCCSYLGRQGIRRDGGNADIALWLPPGVAWRRRYWHRSDSAKRFVEGKQADVSVSA